MHECVMLPYICACADTRIKCFEINFFRSECECLMGPAHHIATALWLCVAGNICSFSFMGVKSAVRKRVG